MALTYTPNNSLNSTCPEFQAKATDNKQYTLSSFKESRVLCFLFICNHCPYVKAIEDRVIELNKYFQDQPVSLIGVCSNDPTDTPEDSFENIQKNWLKKNYNFTYLYDDSQKLAKDFDAVCTPDIFVYNNERKLTYRGRLDDSWKDPSKVTKEELKLAIQDTLDQKPISFKPLASMGCSIKWK